MKWKIIAILVIAAIAAPGLALGMASFDFPVVSPVVTFVAGDVSVKGAGALDWDKAEMGQLLASGDTIKTGPASKAEISCATGIMRLYENTVIIVPEVVNEGDKSDIRQVDLDEGTGLFRIKKRGVEKGFEVKTSNIIAGVKGTLFAVQHEKLKKWSRVLVYSGVVEVTDIGRNPDTLTRLGKGIAMDVEDDEGFGDRDYFDPKNPWNDWKKADSLGVTFLSEPEPDAFDQFEGDGRDKESCPPVVDNDGNVIVQ